MELTREKLINKIAKVFAVRPEQVEIQVINKYDRCIYLEVHKQDGLNCGYRQLKIISQMFKTEKINTSDFTIYGGCDTCGYGALYSITLYIYDIPKYAINNIKD